MKKIALSLEKFSRFSGGAESYAVELAETLQNKGWEVHLIGQSWDGNPPGAVFHKIPCVPKFVPPSLRILYFALSHRSLVRKMDMDVVVGFGNTIEMNVYQSHGGVHFISSLKKIRAEREPLSRIVKTILTFVSPKSLARAWIESAPFRKKTMPAIIAISDMVRNDICKRYKLPPTQIHLIYNGVDLHRFAGRLGKEQSQNFRTSLGFSNEVLFLFMAYDFRKKGVRYLLEAAAKLRDDVGEEKFGVVVVGSSPSPSLLATIRRLRLETTLVFRGPTKEPEHYYEACDVFVLPTFYDACSLVVFEAMACGLPAITTVDNGASGIVTDLVDGSVLDDPRDVETMAASMKRFLDRDYLSKASLAAQRKASRYSIEDNHSKMLAIFEAIAKRDDSSR